LPPDFDELQANAFPPELLKFDNGQAVDSPEKWLIRRQEIRKSLDQYMFGNWPPAPVKTDRL